MKKTDKPTGYILVKATTNSEFDDCDFIIVHITEAWKTTMLQRLQLLAPFKKDNSFSHLAYSENPVGFYTYPEGMQNLLVKKEYWCFINITEEELEALPALDNDLCGYTVNIDSRGWAMYKTYAEQTNDEFYSDDFNIAAVIEAHNK